MELKTDNITVDRLTELSNEQLLKNISLLKRKVEFYYCQELRRIEKNKRSAIIKDLEEFRILQDKYNRMKSLSPYVWFENWEVYNAIKGEAMKRNLSVP